MGEEWKSRSDDEPAGTVHRGGQLAPGAGHATAAAVCAVAAILAECGVHPALGWLNGRTRFRFTGVYRVHGALLVNLGLFDRENPLLNLAGGASPLDESYCAFAAHTSSAFMTADSRADSRLRLHAKRDIVLSYAGVPIRLAGGGVVGTLCHYDARPRFVAPDELAVLEAVAPAFGEWLFARARAS